MYQVEEERDCVFTLVNCLFVFLYVYILGFILISSKWFQILACLSSCRGMLFALNLIFCCIVTLHNVFNKT